jgi:hypothetical protein
MTRSHDLTGGKSHGAVTLSHVITHRGRFLCGGDQIPSHGAVCGGRSVSEKVSEFLPWMLRLQTKMLP